MTYEELRKAAEDVERQAVIVLGMSMANTPTDLEQRVKSQARFAIEKAKLFELRSLYSTKQAAWIAAGMPT